MRTSTHSGHGGIAIACEANADGPIDVLFVHATGFCKELWRPVGEAVVAQRGDVRWMSMDQRAHGGSARGEPPFVWDHLGRDVLGVTAGTTGVHRPVGVGHSSGGASVLRAAIQSPGTFSALVLLEPIVYPPPYGRRDIPLSVGADRRRAVFPDRGNARVRFASGPFRSWDVRILDLYVEHGLADRDRGDVTLSCDPHDEAEFYREGFNHDTWDHLDEIDIPVVVVTGGDSESHQEPYLSTLLSRFGEAHHIVISGFGHLFPMETPDLVGDIVVSTLTS